MKTQYTKTMSRSNREFKEIVAAANPRSSVGRKIVAVTVNSKRLWREELQDRFHAMPGRSNREFKEIVAEYSHTADAARTLSQ